MSITQRSNGKLQARYRGLDGREHAKQFDRKGDAQRWEATQKAAVARGDWIDPAAGNISLAEFAQQWLSTKNVQPRTTVGYEGILSSRVLPRWGSYPLKRITSIGVAQWLRAMADEGLSAARIRACHRVLSMILKLAVDSDRIPKNPVSLVKAPAARPRKPQVLTHEEVFALAEACDPYTTFVLLLAYTGLRWGEATALRVSDVDLVSGRVTVERAFADVRGRLVIGPTKTHRSRWVPLPAFLTPRLAEVARNQQGEDLIFVSDLGTPLRLSNFRKKHWDPAREVAGLPTVTPHVLRHTAATNAIAAGADVKTVQAMLGHENAAMTLNVYADFFPSNRHDVADRLSAAAEAVLNAHSRKNNVIPLPPVGADGAASTG